MVALTTAARSSARSSVSRRKLVVRVQMPTYGAGGHCACIPTSRSITAGRREALPLEQELTGERGAVQLAQREDALGHVR